MRPAAQDDELVAAMARLGERLVGRGAEAVVLSVRSDRTVVGFADVVLKAHAVDTDSDELRARLRVAADARLADVWLPPLPLQLPSGLSSGLSRRRPGGIVVEVCGRLVTAWPAGRPLGPDDSDGVPWERAAAMLARLHAEPLVPGLPAAAVGRRLADVTRRLQDLLAADTADPADPATDPADTAEGADTADDMAAVLRAHAALPEFPRGQALIHGDWHLGQLVECAGLGWRFVDVDDLGVGDPVWDLARPAAWFAAGLVGQEVWARFVDAYRCAGGPALPPDGDPWPSVDLPARAVTVQYAAAALLERAETGQALDGAAVALVECCRRMTAERHPLADLLGTLPASPDVP